ncbi:MAG: F-type H+-transporting ATPase subunit a [Frankiaceae bacterium]|jgi:F-type H+-transporting ATPase subunit a|nr:F-type H+-transporting ATPase subunit a [Frankiaceae bacterium]
MSLAEGVPELGELFNWKFGLWHIPFLNWTVFAMLVAFSLAALFLLTAFNKQEIVPGKLQLVGESLVGFVRTNIAEEVIGHDGVRYVPYLLTTFTLIFAFNFMEVFPGVAFPPSSKIGVPLVFALLSWVVFNVEGMRKNGFGRYWKEILFPPGVPVALYFLLTPIEFLSNIIIRPITLTLRLTFNMLAGHLILSLLAILLLSTVHELGPKVLAAPFVIAIGVGLTGFEIFVGFLQAFIFTVLTALYIGGAVHPQH